MPQELLEKPGREAVLVAPSQKAMSARFVETSCRRSKTMRGRIIIVLVAFIIFSAISDAAAAGDFPSGVPHPGGTMVFSLAGNGGNCAGCEWIAAEGPITVRTPEDFETFLKALGSDADGREMMRLNSNGGNLIAGLELGEAIRTHKIGTEVGQTIPEPADPKWQTTKQGGCYSACAYAFLGGIRRSAETGELGFHQFYTRGSIADAISQSDLDESRSSAQRMMGLLVIYLTEMSVDPALLSIASSADPSSVFQPDAGTMLKMGITNVRGTPLFSGWSIEPYRSGAIVTGKLSGRYNEDQQITFFCRTNVPGKVFMLSSWQYASASSSEAVADNNSIRTAVAGSSVSIGSKVVRRAAGYDSIADAHVDNADRWFLTYTLAGDEFVAALNSGSLQIKIDGPHSLGAFGFTFAPPMAGLAPAARIAFKSCL
jgi:hypothetical protein